MIVNHFEKLEGESNRYYTYKILKENIMELHIKPGEKINEVEVSKKLGVSRTPIREALTKLEAEKLVKIVPKKGTYVSLIDYGLARAGIFMRIIAEKEVLKLACNNFSREALIKLENILEIQKNILADTPNKSEFYILDHEFHKTIFMGSNELDTWKSLDELNIHFNRIRKLRIYDNINLEEILKEHQAIINIIKESDLIEVEEIVSKHLKNLKNSLKVYYKKYPDYFSKP